MDELYKFLADANAAAGRMSGNSNAAANTMAEIGKYVRGMPEPFTSALLACKPVDIAVVCLCGGPSSKASQRLQSYVTKKCCKECNRF